jgi:hypothetical protein
VDLLSVRKFREVIGDKVRAMMKQRRSGVSVGMAEVLLVASRTHNLVREQNTHI